MVLSVCDRQVLVLVQRDRALEGVELGLTRCQQLHGALTVLGWGQTDGVSHTGSVIRVTQGRTGSQRFLAGDRQEVSVILLCHRGGGTGSQKGGFGRRWEYVMVKLAL